jgi:hypothetical protein
LGKREGRGRSPPPIWLGLVTGVGWSGLEDDGLMVTRMRDTYAVELYCRKLAAKWVSIQVTINVRASPAQPSQTNQPTRQGPQQGQCWGTAPVILTYLWAVTTRLKALDLTCLSTTEYKSTGSNVGHGAETSAAREIGSLSISSVVQVRY